MGTRPDNVDLEAVGAAAAVKISNTISQIAQFHNPGSSGAFSCEKISGSLGFGIWNLEVLFKTRGGVRAGRRGQGWEKKQKLPQMRAHERLVDPIRRFFALQRCRDGGVEVAFLDAILVTPRIINSPAI